MPLKAPAALTVGEIARRLKTSLHRVEYVIRSRHITPAASRYGGLRCPSEHLALRWGDIDRERNRIRVTSPKSARHGKSRNKKHDSPAIAEDCRAMQYYTNVHVGPGGFEPPTNRL